MMEHVAVVAPVNPGSELTIYQVAERYEALSERLKRDGELQLDLSSVTDIDSAGIQLLLQLAHQAKQHSGTVSFLNPSTEVQRMMALFRLSTDFDTQQVQGEL
jgi:anti-sigma B factor antagonist